MTDGDHANRRADMRAAIDAGARELKQVDLGTIPRALATMTLRVLKRERDPQKALDALDSLARELRQFQRVVDRIRDSGRRGERDEAARRPFERAWLAERKRRLRDLDPVEQRTERLALWLSAWMDAVVARRWNAALTVSAWTERGHLDASDVRGDMDAVVHDLRANRPPTLSAVDGLLSVDALPVSARVGLLALKTRSLLRHLGNPEEAGRLAITIEQVAAGDTGTAVDRTLARAVRAEVCLAEGDLEATERLVGDAIASEDEIADRIVVAGLLALSHSDFAGANATFSVCAQRFGPDVAESRLLSEVPANLVWALARQQRASAPGAALGLYDRAITLGIRGKTPTTRRKAIYEKAELLAELGRPAEAAAAFSEAAELYSQVGAERSLKAYELAHQLDPGRAEYAWALAEELRFRGMESDGRHDAVQLHRAEALLEEGLRLAGATETPSWVVVSIGLTAHALGSRPDPLLWLERALLRDPDNVNYCGLLAWAHRLDGHPRAALRAAQYGFKRDPSNMFLIGQLMLSHMDLSEYHDVRALLADGPIDTSAPAMALFPAWLELRTHQGEAALREVDAASSEPADAALMRIAAYDLIGDHVRAKAEAETLWKDRDALGDPAVAGWAAYRSGLVDDAITVIDALRATSTTLPLHDVILGQALLLRGDPAADDLERGAHALLTGIDRTVFADELIGLRQIDLPLALQLLDGLPHENEAAAIFNAAHDAAGMRVSELQEDEPDDGLLSRVLAEARERRDAGDIVEALSRYADLARSGDVPETAAAMRDISTELMARGNHLLEAGDLHAAHQTWRQVARQLHIAGPHVQLPDGLSTRLGLCALERYGVDDPETIPNLLAGSAASLREALPRFARTMDLVWTYEDRLGEVAARVSPEYRARFEDLLDVLSPQRLLRLARADVAPAVTTRPVRAVEIVVGGAHRDQRHSPFLSAEIRALRSRLTRETGVWIPGVGVDMNDDPGDTDVELRVFERTARRMKLAVADAGPDGNTDEHLARAIMAHFEPFVRDNLFRWISVDDLDLWNAGWTATPEVRTPLPVDLVDRVRLTRVLRSLLSEGLPISDREAILAGFQAGSGVAAGLRGADAGDGSLAIMTEIRRRLLPAVLGADRAAVVAVPAALEARIADGISGSRWSLARTRALSVQQDLTSWRNAAGPDGGAARAIYVQDAAVRPYVWHLLAAERPPVFVVAATELALTRPSR